MFMTHLLYFVHCASSLNLLGLFYENWLYFFHQVKNPTLLRRDEDNRTGFRTLWV
jgi:hypothetical protein